LAARARVEVAPGNPIWVGHADRLAGASVELGHELDDRPSPIGELVVPGIEDL